MNYIQRVLQIDSKVGVDQGDRMQLGWSGENHSARRGLRCLDGPVGKIFEKSEKRA
ncbi:MAG: hypothetical protein HFF06_06070 [Oscillospiraceae bacterium]|nr:hypothetical protein [Oscillospiraceae bacterium]